MSALTQNERDGLDDVFLSIHTSQYKFQKIKDIVSKILSSDISITLSSVIKEAKRGLKKKKNLSK